MMTASLAVMVLAGCGGGSSDAAQAAETEAPGTGAAGEEALQPIAGLKEAVSSERGRAFYEARDWRPIWTESRTRALVQLVGEAPRHGLESATFLKADLPADPAMREAALTETALAYAEALAKGRVDPAAIFEVYTLERPQVDVGKALAAAVQQDRLQEWLGGLAPEDAAYKALSEAYLRYRQQAGQEKAASIAEGEAIEVGAQDPRVAPIAAALARRGYLSADQMPSESEAARTYTAAMADAVKRLQREHGLKEDGVVGADTLKLLNTGSAERARQLAVNLERRRWLVRDPAPTRIDVNTATAQLEYWHEGKLVDRRKVVVGQEGWETPQLGSPIYRLVANPTWTVPKSIEREEIAPRGAAYLRRNNMVRRDGWIVQQPGPDNALGQVKFDMQNEHAIYLHDTPAKQLFGSSERHRSHGCVRVEKAPEFARLLAEQHGKLEEFEKAFASGKETFVPLDQKIPVRLVYHTAFAEPDGQVRLHSDAYGWDEDVAEALGLDKRARRAAATHATDVGP